MTQKNSKLYVGWYDASEHFWYPVGQICTTAEGFQFEYLSGAIQARNLAGFRGIFQFPDFNQKYVSKELFAFFTNRLLTSSRDNFDEEVEKMGLKVTSQELHPFDVLSRTNGRRVTDTFEVYPPPTVTDDSVELIFFVRGVRYLSDELKRRWEDGKPPQHPLRLYKEPENKYDSYALRILDSDDYPLGFVPRYYTKSFYELVDRGCQYQLDLLLHNRHPGFVRERFLVKLTCRTFDGWRFPQSDLYESIAEQSGESILVA